MRINSEISIGKDELSPQEWRQLLDKLTFYDAEQQEISAYRYAPAKRLVRISRGAWNLMPEKLVYQDLRARPRGRTFPISIELDAEGYAGQRNALEAMQTQQQGQVVLPPAFGKTNIGLAFAAQCGTPTLVVTHTHDLFDQWMQRAQAVVPDARLGQIRGAKIEIGDITIAMVQTIRRHVRDGAEFWRRFGCLIFDEAHHAAASTWEGVANACPAYYRFGLTATTMRADERQPLCSFVVGPVIYRVPFESQVPIEVQPVKTDFRYSGDAASQYNFMLKKIERDSARNSIIAKIATDEIAAGHRVLVLSRRIEHLRNIHALMGAPEDVLVLTGELGRVFRKRVVDGFRSGKIAGLLATQLADEGLDVPELDRLILSFPGKAQGRIIQQIGRTSRRSEGKAGAVVYDIVDRNVSVLVRQYSERRQVYKTLQGVTVRKAVDGGKERQPTLLDRIRERRAARSS